MVAALAAVAITLISIYVTRRAAASPDLPPLPTDPYQRALALQALYPMIDGHNDLAWALREYVWPNILAFLFSMIVF